MGIEDKDFLLGSVRVSPQRNRLITQNKQVPIEPRVMEVLCCLVNNAGNVVTRGTLIEKLWKVEYGGDESLTRSISILRKSFKSAGLKSRIIETIPKSGYRLILSPNYDFPVDNVNFPETVSNPNDQDIKETDRNRKTPILLSLFALIICVLIVWFFTRTTNEKTPNSPPSTSQSPDLIHSDQLDRYTMNQLFASDIKNLPRTKAITEIRKALAEYKDHGNVEYITASGWVDYFDEDLDEALLSFEKAISLDSDRHVAWLGKARIYQDRQQYSLAKVAAEKAIALEPNSILSAYIQVDSLIEEGNLQEARSQLRLLQAEVPRSDLDKDLKEKVALFFSYDKNADLRITVGEISNNDADFQTVLNQDKKNGIALREFKVRGDLFWSKKSETELVIQLILFDLTNPSDPQISYFKQDGSALIDKDELVIVQR